MGERGVRLVRAAPGAAGAEALLELLPAALAGDGPAVAIAPDGDDEVAGAARAAVLPDDAMTVDADVALIVATSGSTGSPRGVLLPGPALLASARATEERLGGPAAWSLCLPVTSIGGLMVLVRSLVAGTEPEVLASIGGAAPFSPAAFAAATWRLDPSVPAVTSVVPAQAARLLDDPEGRAALQAYDAVLVGGGRLSSSLRGRVLEAHVAAVSTYGMTETCGGLVYDGIPLPGADAAIVEPDADGVGRVSLGGPMVARGYVGDPAPSSFGGGRLLTQDLGRVVDGVLEVLGRADDVVQVGGVNVAVSAVEDALVPPAREAVVLAAPDETWGARLTAYVVDGPADDDLAAAVSSRLGRAAVPRAWVRLDSLPLLANGKPDRGALRRLG
ncbi:MAG: AMP-binding protein [Actinobacteria bacterium]|nr:AMP-binding protein [Actinomycetota bacterium]